MRNKILFLLFMVLFSISISATVTENPIKLTSNNTNHNGTHHRSLPTEINVYQEGDVLTFGIDYSGFEIEIVDSDDSMVFYGIIDSNGLITLPDTLEGTYELRLIIEDTVFSGEILFE